MIKPNYKDGSILNLMVSIEKAFAKNAKYKPLKSLSPAELKKYDNVILLVIDGLGYNYVKHYRDCFMKNNLREKITTVFPSTTPCAIATFLNGTPPSEHGILGLFLHIPELNETVVTIRHSLRKDSLQIDKSLFKELYNITPFSNRLNVDTFHLDEEKVINSVYTQAQAGKSEVIGYVDINDCFNKLKNIVKSSKNKKYVYAHIPNHDSLCHEFGVSSPEVSASFDLVDSQIKKFISSVDNTNTILIVTGDHGMIDVPKKNMILIKNHSDIKLNLKKDMYGQSRYANCIAVNKTKLKDSILKKFSSKLIIMDKEKAAKLYGPKMSTRFKNRIGDFVILMKDNYGIYDLPTEKDYLSYDYNTCDHGSLTENEMYVPLIIIKTNNLLKIT